MKTPDHPDLQLPRQFIQGPLTQQMARPAMRDEVMRALHHLPHGRAGRFVEMRELEKLLQPRDWGVWSVLHALAELGMVELFPAYAGRPFRVTLTDTGRAWDPGSTEPSEPMRFAYQVDGDLVVGTLEDWAKVWEHGQYSGDVLLSDVLITWKNRDPGYTVQVDRLSGIHGDEDGYIRYRVWAAGDMANVSIDGRA